MTNSAAVRICKAVRRYAGCSLDHRRDELATLVARGVDDPDQAVLWRTNCGTFALGILHEVGLYDDLLRSPYRIGFAITWLETIAKNLHVYAAWRPWDSWTVLRPGMLLRYCSPGKANDHVEWLLDNPDKLGTALHGGGGRPRNAITVASGTIQSNAGRPLVCYYDFPAALEAEEAYPHDST